MEGTIQRVDTLWNKFLEREREIVKKKIILIEFAFSPEFILVFNYTTMSKSGNEADTEVDSTPKSTREEKEISTPSDMFSKSLEASDKKRSEMLRRLALGGRKEIGHIIAKADTVSQEGKLSYSYTFHDWSPWFIETTGGDEIQEYAMLQGLQAKLQHRGYDAVVTRPYRGSPDEKVFLHISWNRPESYLLLGGCVERSHMKIISKFMAVFLFSMAVCICTGGFFVLFYYLLFLSLSWGR